MLRMTRLSADSVDIFSVYRESVHESIQCAQKRPPACAGGPPWGVNPFRLQQGAGERIPVAVLKLWYLRAGCQGLFGGELPARASTIWPTGISDICLSTSIFQFFCAQRQISAIDPSSSSFGGCCPKTCNAEMSVSAAFSSDIAPAPKLLLSFCLLLFVATGICR